MQKQCKIRGETVGTVVRVNKKISSRGTTSKLASPWQIGVHRKTLWQYNQVNKKKLNFNPKGHELSKGSPIQDMKILPYLNLTS